MSIITPKGFISSLKLLRVKDWSVQNGIFLLGCFFSDDLFCYNAIVVVMSLVLACLCLAYAYSLNEYFDVLKEKLVNNAKESKEIVCLVYFFLIGAFVLSICISITTFIVVALIGVTVWLHSSPPFLLKRRMFWRLFLNSLGFGLFFLAGASLDGRLSNGEILMGAFVFTLYLPLELVHVLAHMDSDRVKGFRTFALVYGQRRTIGLAAGLLALLAIYSGLLWRWKFASMTFALWSVLHLLVLLVVLLAPDKLENNAEMFARLRFRTKLICAAYGTGMLVILIARF